MAITSGIYYFNRNALVACPEDARLCPDGTAVSREDPDCKFVSCPKPVCRNSICEAEEDSNGTCPEDCVELSLSELSINKEDNKIIFKTKSNSNFYIADKSY